MKYHIEKDKFEMMVKQSESMGHLLDTLGIIKAGGNYSTMKHRILEWNIDISHWTKTRRKRQGWQKGKSGWRAHPIGEYLVKNTPYKGSSHKLKLRLIKENIFERKCYNCGNTKWLGNPTPIELEHKNGDKFDCRIENLTLLCPNCHALTSTYRGKNKKH